MVSSIRFPIITPVGAGVEFFDEDDPILMAHPLVIQAPLGMAEVIFRKFCHYRMWHKLREGAPSFPTFPAETSGRITDVVQALYLHNEDSPDFFNGVDSVTLTYPKSFQCRVTKQMAGLPSRLSLVSNSSVMGARKSIHVQGREGTKSLAVLEQSLDIEVPDNEIFICLNNLNSPPWITAVPRSRPPMEAFARPTVLNEKEVSEQAAWERVSSWLSELGLSVQGLPYPNGENSFPDYRAWIRGQEYDVEITSVPDMKKWTIKSTYRNLEKFISEVAKHRGETKQDVVEDLQRVLTKKRERVKIAAEGDVQRPCILVITNWSVHKLSDEAYWPKEDLRAFEAAILVDRKEVRIIPPNKSSTE